MKTYIMDSLRFPPSLLKRRNELAGEVDNQLNQMNLHYQLPLTAIQRAELVFCKLKIKRSSEEGKIHALSIHGLHFYKDQHPLLIKLAEYEGYLTGARTFCPHSMYEKYKTEAKNRHWVYIEHFNKGGNNNEGDVYDNV